MSNINLRNAWDAATLPPDGWQGDLYFHNRLGQKLRYGHAPASVKNPEDAKGSIVLTHGYSEHIDLYYETIKKYQGMGYNVWAMDWQGHGKSERDDPTKPLRPSAKGMLRHTLDLDYFVNNIVRDNHNPDTPLIMSTNSMGGHIGLLYLKKYPGVFDGAIMSTPMFDIYRLGMGRWGRPIIRGIFNIASAIGLHDTHVPGNAELIRMVKNVGRTLKDVVTRSLNLRGEIHTILKDNIAEARLGRPTFGWIASAYKTIVPSMDEDFLKTIKTPILIGSAEYEDLVANDAHVYAAGIMPNAKAVKIPDSSHGLWFDNDDAYDAWWHEIDEFLPTIKAENPHERLNSSFVEDIVDGENVAKTLKGRQICAKRCPFGTFEA